MSETMLHPPRCANRISALPKNIPDVACGRPSTGKDGLCNICRAARRNGEKRRTASETRRLARSAREERNFKIVVAASKYMTHRDAKRLAAEVERIWKRSPK